MRFGMGIVGLAFIVCSASANPRVAAERPTLDTPRLWLAQEHPTPGSRTALLHLFEHFGIDLGEDTVRLIDRNFDRFAPVMVEAQSPPRTVRPDLQRWYRERADHDQAEAMKTVLRAWLEPGANTNPGSPNRAYAVEALGDWRDSAALPRLRELPPAPFVTASIRRIEDPEHADPIAVRKDGSLSLQRPLEELDSIVVVSYDPMLMENRTWRPDPKSERRILHALASGTRVRKVNERGISTLVGTVYVSYRDGREIRLTANGDGWRIADNGRFNQPSIDVISRRLDEAIDEELTRVGILPRGPRFTEESVTMWIHRNEMRVLGVYAFEGRPERGMLTLEYPFPVDSSLGSPRVDTIFLDTDSPSGSAAHVDLRSGQIPWRVDIKPGDANTYRLIVGYRQDLRGRSATYLLRSALDWKRPLRKASFYVHVDEELGTPSFKYAFTKGPGGNYVFQASPFRPERDLVVRW